MNNSSNMGQVRAKLIGIFLLGVVLIHFPVVELFSRMPRLWGIPGAYFAIFGVWLALIGLIKHYADPERRNSKSSDV